MKNKSDLHKKIVAFIVSFGFVFAAAGGAVALASITLSNTGITGDSSFTTITGTTSTVIDVGAGTLSLQTASSGPITTGVGLFTVGGALNVSSTANVSSTLTVAGVTTLASTTINGNATGTSLNLSGALNVSSTFAQSGGLVSLASTTFKGNATGTSLNLSGALGVSSTLTQSGGLVSLASTTVSGLLSVSGHIGSVTSSVSVAGGVGTVLGSDNAGLITVSTSTTSYTLVFASPWSSVPVCTANVASGTALSLSLPSRTTSTVITAGSAIPTSTTIGYICMGNPN